MISIDHVLPVLKHAFRQGIVTVENLIQTGTAFAGSPEGVALKNLTTGFVLAHGGTQSEIDAAVSAAHSIAGAVADLNSMVRPAPAAPVESGSTTGN